jgi:hypothetical protein
MLITKFYIIFLFAGYNVQNGYGVCPATCPVRTGGLSSGAKRLGREANNSPPACVSRHSWFNCTKDITIWRAQIVEFLVL